KMEEKFDDTGPVAMQVFLQVHDRAIPIAPDRILIDQFIRETLGAENLGMYTNDQHFFVVGAIEDADPAALRQFARRVPQEVVFQLFGTWVFETEDLATL